MSATHAGNEPGQFLDLGFTQGDGPVVSRRAVGFHGVQKLQGQQISAAFESKLCLDTRNLPGVGGVPIERSIVWRSWIEWADPRCVYA